jgi:hypothetical protein
MENINIINEILKIYGKINNFLGFDCLVIIAIIVGVRLLKAFIKIKSTKALYGIIMLCSIPAFFIEWLLFACTLSESFRIALTAPFIAMAFYGMLKGLFPNTRLAKWLVNGKMK